jgi:putative sterol carrier protein
VNTPQEIFDAMAEQFQPEKAKGINAVIQYNLSGENGGEWYTSIADGTCTVTKGTSEEPRLTINMTDEDFVAMSSGNANPIQLFMSGKVKVQGDLMMAQSMMNWFGL